MRDYTITDLHNNFEKFLDELRLHIFAKQLHALRSGFRVNRESRVAKLFDLYDRFSSARDAVRDYACSGECRIFREMPVNYFLKLDEDRAAELIFDHRKRVRPSDYEGIDEADHKFLWCEYGESVENFLNVRFCLRYAREHVPISLDDRSHLDSINKCYDNLKQYVDTNDITMHL
jgi:hypothetical protein